MDKEKTTAQIKITFGYIKDIRAIYFGINCTYC